MVKINSSTIIGIDSYPVGVEVDLSPGLPQFSIVGLPDAAVRESKDRIKAAIKNAGFPFPKNKVIINLAPADIKKEGTSFDLPIACAILAAEGYIPTGELQHYMVIGEVSLDGSIKGVHGTLSAAFQARNMGLKGIILSPDNAPEAAMIEEVQVIAVDSLRQMVDFLTETITIKPTRIDVAALLHNPNTHHLDFNEVSGQSQAKRAMEVAAAGGHNILMVGPPGSGKTMLAQRLTTILPDISCEEALETTKVFSVAGLLDKKKALITERPFRAPHHSISDAGLVGGGHVPKPGEISLAHNGILFLDELPEFKRNVLEVLRQPLEDGLVTIARASLTVTYPARFMLVAAMNPCPCGYLTDTQRTCRCSYRQIRQYQTKVSGPLLDRMDIHIEVPSLPYRDLTNQASGESSRLIKARVDQARKFQRERNHNRPIFNAHLTNRQIRKFCPLDSDSKRLLETAMERLALSARAYNKILKIARTIADLEGTEHIKANHISEAIQYRSLDRKLS